MSLDPEDFIFNKKIKMNELEKKEMIIDFLSWLNETSGKHPMAFETDHEDIALMYLNKTY